MANGALTRAQQAFQQRVQAKVNAPSTQRDVLKAAGLESSPEKAAGAQKQMKSKIKRRPRVAKIQKRSAPSQKVQRAGQLKMAGAPGYSAQQRVDVMKAAGYTPQEIGQFMQREGQRLLQQGWERQNVGRFQPP